MPNSEIEPFHAANVTAAGSNLPCPGAAEQFEIDVLAFRTLDGEIRKLTRDLLQNGRDPEGMPATVATAKQFAETDWPRLQARAMASRRPASQADIARHLGVLVGCMAGGKVDMAVYAAALIEDVGALRPSIAALESACRALRRKATFAPSIAEVLAAIQEADNRHQTACTAVEGFPALVDSIEQARSDGLARLAKEKADDRRCTKRRLLQILDEGGEVSDSWDERHPGLAAEVRAQLKAEEAAFWASCGEPEITMGTERR
jgi:hypothetical protein